MSCGLSQLETGDDVVPETVTYTDEERLAALLHLVMNDLHFLPEGGGLPRCAVIGEWGERRGALLALIVAETRMLNLDVLTPAMLALRAEVEQMVEQNPGRYGRRDQPGPVGF